MTVAIPDKPKPTPRKRVAAVAGTTEDAFLAAIDTRLDVIGEKLDKATSVVAGAKRRSWLALLGALVAIGLGADSLYLHQQLNQGRHASRVAVCRTTNEGIERDRKKDQALLDNTIPNRPLTQAEKDRIIEKASAYEKDQGFRYNAATGQVEAPVLDCDKFADDPATAKPEFKIPG